MESALAKAKNGLLEAKTEVTKDNYDSKLYFLLLYYLFLNSGMTNSCSHSGCFS